MVAMGENSTGRPAAGEALAQKEALSDRGEQVLFVGHPAVVQSASDLLWMALTIGVFAAFAWFRSRAVHYRVTSQRVVVERGLLSKRMDQLDLYRVVDFAVERPLGQRIVGTGNLILESIDKTSPEIRIQGIRTDVVALYEKLRTCTEVEKQRRNVRLLDVESAQ